MRLARSHRREERLEAVHLLVVDVHVAELRHAGHHPEDLLHRAELPDHPQLREHVLEREAPEDHLLEARLRFGLGDRFLRALDEADDVAETEDAAGHALGLEDVEVVDLLADAREEDGAAGDGLEGERGTAARVAVELREDDAGERELLVEGFRRVHGVLAGHRVDDEDRVRRADGGGDLDDLLHHLGVDVEATGGVEEDEVRRR
jgi:hypothetical protein